MINFLDLLFPSASGTIAKSLSESRAKFSLSRRLSDENIGGPQGLVLTSSWLIDGLRLRPKRSKPIVYFFLISSFLTPFSSFNTKHLHSFVGWEMVLVLSCEIYLLK